jgi:hypothetical protein
VETVRAHLLLGLVAIGACLDPLEYPCTAMTQCTVDGKDGTCHASGWCVYDDTDCPSGKRFGPAAGNGLADECADADSVGGSEGATSIASTSSETGMDCEPCDAPPSPCFADVGVCDRSSGVCEYEQMDVGMPCDDEDSCTRDETCDAQGECVPAETTECDDPPECFELPATCDAEGVCSYTPSAAGSDCEDEDPCTLNSTCDTTGTCQPGPICETKGMCSTGVCMDGVGCMLEQQPDGTSCGVNPADRCCGGECVDVSTDAAHCGGCGAACQSDEVCESVADTAECDPHPAFTSGRCTCSGENLDCPMGQVCRTLTPVANRCAPDAEADCHSGMFVDVEACPNYCSYPMD